MPEDQSTFKGWAVVEVMGHQRWAGLVTTETFGGTVMFRVDIPALESKKRVLEYGEYINGAYESPGSVVESSGTQPCTKLFGAASIYCITPCTEEVAIGVVAETMSPAWHLLSLPATACIAGPIDKDERSEEQPF